MISIKNLYYKKIRGIDLDMIKSGREGIWFKDGVKGIEFLKIRVLDNRQENLIRLLDLLQRIFPEEEIVGRNYRNKSFIEINKRGFSRDQQKRVKQSLKRLLDKRGIYNNIRCI